MAFCCHKFRTSDTFADVVSILKREEPGTRNNRIIGWVEDAGAKKMTMVGGN